jgi:hypothetical protein
MSQVIADLERRLARLDARAKAAPAGQLGLDLTGGGGTGKGQPCGQGWISKDKTCQKGAGGGSYRPTPQVKEGLSIKPMVSGEIEYDVAAERKKNKGASKFWRSSRNGRPAYSHYFRDRQAVEHWMAEDSAQADADLEIGSDKRRSKEWQAEFKQSYSDHRLMYANASDYDLLESAERWVGAGKATRGGTAIDVRIGGNKHSRPIREGFFAASAEPVLTNPGRTDPGLAPKAKPQGLSAQDVITSKRQGEFARQQQQAAKAAGDQRGAAAWRQQERKAERARLQTAMQGNSQSQTSLFGVTEYDETLPLFGRRDSVDRVSRLLGQVLSEYLPKPQVIEWDASQGTTHGRVVSEGLLYGFRCDADSVSYRPAWSGINERQWESRSEGFLQARYPEMRLDFKFNQKRSKRKCSKGYGCGNACISMNKECRVQAKNAISKARLKALRALAMEGDATAAQKARDVQMQRDEKAQELKGDRQVGKLKKMLEDPRIAELVRTGRLPAEEGKAEQAAPKPGDVRNVTPDGIEVDPDRFQYKIGSSATGEVGSLSGVRRWDPNLAGVISVWQDPDDGKTYVVNGHNRLALARRLGAENVTVRYLDAPDARTARAIGAKQNIAEGAGTETDAAKFFRDTGIKTMEQVEEQGLPLRSGKAEKGLALAKLPEEMFQDVVQGRLRMRQAALIGASGLDEDKQREVYKVIKKNPKIQDETLGEYVEQLAFSERQKQTTLDLFGEDETSVDTGLARADLTKSIKKTLSQEARLLASVSKSQKAVEILQEKGGNVINVGQSQEKAGEANTVLRLFDQLKLTTGPISSALDQAAARITAGESRSAVLKELREQVVQGMDEELQRLGLKPTGGDSTSREAESMSMFDAADRIAEIEARIDAAKRKCNTGYACGNSCISPAKECRSEGKASTGKQRLKRLKNLAAGGKTGRGIGQLRGGAAAAKAEEINALRSAKAAQLRQQRAKRPGAGPARERGGALVVSGGRGLQTQGPPDRNGTKRRGGLADTLKASLDQMKAADARQFGLIAEQLFEASWSLEKNGRYKGMNKGQARDSFKQDFMRQMQAQQASPEARARSQKLQEKAAKSGSVAGAMKAIIEDMKAGDQRLQEIGEKAIDLRLQAFELEQQEGNALGTLGGGSTRRRLRGTSRSMGRRKDSPDRFDAAVGRLLQLAARVETGVA